MISKTIQISVFVTVFGILIVGCNTALDPTVDECDTIGKIYCIDSKTRSQCMVCSDPSNSSDGFACWKVSTCHENYECRYTYSDYEKKTVVAGCYDPDSPRYQNTYAEDPEK